MATDSLSDDVLNSIIDQVYGNDAEATPAFSESSDEDEGNGGDESPDESVEADDGDQSDEDLADDDSWDDDETGDEPDEDSDVSVDEESDSDGGVLSELVTVKVNGEDMQITVDQAVKGYQLAAASNARFEEAARIREEAAGAIEFAQGFEAAWTSDPAQLISHFVSQVEDPNPIVEAVILRAAATGKLSANVAEALGLDQETSERLALKFEREELERQKAEIRQDDEDVPDEHGLTREDYANAFREILHTEGLDESEPEAKQEFLRKILEHGDNEGIANPLLAYASFQRQEARRQSERQARAKRAVKKVTKESATAAALAPKGRVQHAPTETEAQSTADAAAAAIAELEKKYGALA